MMFADNKKISARQTFRLLLFCSLGISSLLIPARLAQTAGELGAVSIVLGGLLGAVYLLYLRSMSRLVQVDYIAQPYGKKFRLFYCVVAFLLFVHCICTAAYCTDVFVRLMLEYLVQSEAYEVILAMTLLLAGYAVMGGIESWVRIYEVLFWFVFLPFLLLLAVGARSVEMVYWRPQAQIPVLSVIQGSYLVFVFLVPAFWVLFLSDYIRTEQGKKKVFQTAGRVLAATLLLLLAVYAITLGTFGAGALSKMPFPAITLMSTIQVSGNFIKRLDAVMLGVWFFALLSFLTLNLFFGTKMLKGLAGVKEIGDDGEKKRYLAVVLASVAILVLVGQNRESLWEYYERYIWYAGTPFFVLLPALLGVIGRGEKNK